MSRKKQRNNENTHNETPRDNEKPTNTPTGADFRSIAESDAAKCGFPARIPQEYRVYIDPDAYNRMMKHAETTDEVELCGVLVGDVCRDDLGFFLHVTAIIEGQAANNYGTQVTFTHDTWTHIYETKDKSYPDKRIVGWYHTHPGFGVFLSKMDTFVQENFFNQPYQVAIVIETKNKTEGCFIWKNSKPVPIPHYWVGDKEKSLAMGQSEAFDVKNPLSEESPAQESLFASEAPPGRMGIGWGAIFLMALFLITGYLFGKLNGAAQLYQEMGRSFETEISSLLEFSSLNTLAFNDFEDIKTSLAEIRAITEKNSEPATEKIDELDSKLATLMKTYTRRRSDLNLDLYKISTRSRSLNQRVSDMQRESTQVKYMVADLYFLRLQEMVNPGAKFDPATYTSLHLQTIRLMLGRCLELNPGNKTLIEQAFPGLMEYFYPRNTSQTNDAKDDNKTSGDTEANPSTSPIQ